MTNHIVLFEPEIPANTGNIARTCAATNTHLHLIEPLGFKIDDKHLKRAGLDYWNQVQVTVHESLPAFLDYLGDRQLFLVTKFADQRYDKGPYPSDKDLFFMFGRESKGLPEDFMRQHPEVCIRVPMNDQHVRSLNLSNTAAIIIYEVLRQQAFNDLDLVFHYEHDKLK